MATSYYYFNCQCWQNWLYSIINHANLEDAGQVAAGDVDAHVRLVLPLHLARQQHLQGLLNNYFPLQSLCLSWIEPLSLFHRSQRGDTRWHRSDSRCTTLNIPKHQVKHSIKIKESVPWVSGSKAASWERIVWRQAFQSQWPTYDVLGWDSV